MTNLKYKTRGNSTPQGKPRVYFCCHKNDFDKYFDEISNEVLTKQNCAIWFADEAVEYNEDLFLDLKQMQLFVMPVTTNLLCTENSALNIEFRFAVENHIPVLPLMQENGLIELFNKKCGELQFLDKHNTDITAISYDEKLEKYLSSVLIGDELAEKIRAAFDAYVFLSYRKKDRKYAQELMRLIHKNDFCRDIAIWYDEFLTPGENFNDSIKDALQKSELFVLTVTPNLVNETNYIMTTEYPMARQDGKTILPAELVPTDRQKLSEKYVDIPVPTDAHNETELSEALLESIKKIAVKENDNSPEHNFFIGLAYLSGIDVEVDHEKAVHLITRAADDGVFEATDKLFTMYLNGIGVQRNYDKASEWFCKKIDILKKRVAKEGSDSDYTKLISELVDLGQYYIKTIGDYSAARETYSYLNDVCKKAYQNFETLYFKSKLGTSYVYLAQSHIDLREYDLAEERISDAYKILKGINSDYIKEITDNLQTATIGQLFDYYASHNDLATLYEGLAEIAQKRNEFEKVEEYLLRCLEFRQEVEKFFKEHDTAKLNVAGSYMSLAKYYQERGDFSKVVEYYDKGYSRALNIANQTKSLYAGEVVIRFNMIRAQVHIKQKENDEAVKYYITNIGFLEASKLTPQMEALKAENYYNASKLCFDIEDFEQAALFINKYLYICNKLYDSKKYGDIFTEVLDYLTECNIKAGKIQETIEIHRRHLESKYNLYVQTGNCTSALLYNMGLLSIGDVYLRCGKYTESEKAYNDALKFAKTLRKDYENATEYSYAISVLSHNKMAKMYEELKYKRKEKKSLMCAVKTAKSALNSHRTEGTYRQAFETYGRMGDWYKSNNLYKQALKCYTDAAYLAEEAVAVFRKEEDKYFLASLYLTAGTIQGKNSNELLRKSKKLWQELLEKAPTSEKYQYGNSLINSALKTDDKGEVQEHEITSDKKQVTITLINDSGVEELYELLDLVKLNGDEYVVLMSVDDVEDDVLILRVGDSNEEENKTNYLPIEDEELLTVVFDLFRERNKDRFNFAD